MSRRAPFAVDWACLEVHCTPGWKAALHLSLRALFEKCSKLTSFRQRAGRGFFGS